MIKVGKSQQEKLSWKKQVMKRGWDSGRDESAAIGKSKETGGGRCDLYTGLHCAAAS